jgi:hypothetical protein
MVLPLQPPQIVADTRRPFMALPLPLLPHRWASIAKHSEPAETGCK